MTGLTQQMANLYQFLCDRHDDTVGPSYEEMAGHLGLSSKSNVNRLLVSLRKRGMVQWTPGVARSVRPVRRDTFAGVSSAAMIAELKRRGEWPHGG